MHYTTMMIELLGSPSFRERERATSQLGRMGASAYDRVREQGLRHPDLEVRQSLRRDRQEEVQGAERVLLPQLDMMERNPTVGRYLSRARVEKPLNWPWYNAYREATRLYLVDRLSAGEDPKFVRERITRAWLWEIAWYLRAMYLSSEEAWQ